MKLGHWILIAVAVLLVIYFASSSNKPTYGYIGGGTWYDRMIASVGLGLGTYVRTAGPNAFGGPVTSGGVKTSNPVEWGSSGYGYQNSPYADKTQSGGGTAGLQAYYNDKNIGEDVIFS